MHRYLNEWTAQRAANNPAQNQDIAPRSFARRPPPNRQTHRRRTNALRRNHTPTGTARFRPGHRQHNAPPPKPARRTHSAAFPHRRRARSLGHPPPRPPLRPRIPQYVRLCRAAGRVRHLVLMPAAAPPPRHLVLRRIPRRYLSAIRAGAPLADEPHLPEGRPGMRGSRP